MSLQAGQIVADKYRILRVLGQGGMGEVYEGENTRIHRRVAIKTLLSGVASRTDVVQRFEREAQAAGRIGSEHIVEVLDLGDLPDGSRYMVMEFLEGSTLSDRIVSRGRVPPREAARIVIELCEGLDAAHQAGIIHRDLKPANVFLITSKQGRPDFVKILDFGVSKFSVLADEMSMTRTGAVVGTPYYMSPEQAKGAKFIDQRSDLYSVGVILYESITGQVPFNAQTFNELIFKIALESPPPPESFVPDLDPHFASIVRRAMSRDPNERFQSATEFKRALEAWTYEWDRASSSGIEPVGQGAHLRGPGMPRNGATQMLPAQGAGPGFSAAFTSPLDPKHSGQNWPAPAQVATPGHPGPGPGGHVGHPPMQQGYAAVAPAVPKRGGGALVPVMVAMIVALVTAAAAATFVVLKRPSLVSKPALSTTATSEARPSSSEPSPPTPVVSPPAASASTVAVDDLPSPSATISSSAPAPPPPTGPVGPAPHSTYTPPPHVATAPTTKPTAKPPSTGRPITGDL